MPDLHLGPWKKGWNNRSSVDSVDLDALTVALNVDISSSGHLSTHDTWVQEDGTEAHDIVEFDGRVFGVVGGYLGELSDAGFTAFTPESGRVAWTVLNGGLVFANQDGVYRVDGDQVTRLTAVGTMDMDDDRVLANMPGGNCIGYWQGRLLVARGTTLFWSEPQAYGTCDTFRNYVRFPSQISWIAPLEGGVYVGADEVYFLDGVGPASMKFRRVYGKCWRGAGAVLPTTRMETKISQAAPYVAVWFGEHGFAQWRSADSAAGAPG